MGVLNYGRLVRIMHDWLLADHTFETDQDTGIKTYEILIRNHRAPISDSANVRCGSRMAVRYCATTCASSRTIMMAGQRVTRFGLQILRAYKQLITQYVINVRFRLFHVGNDCEYAPANYHFSLQHLSLPLSVATSTSQIHFDTFPVR